MDSSTSSTIFWAKKFAEHMMILMHLLRTGQLPPGSFDPVAAQTLYAAWSAVRWQAVTGQLQDPEQQLQQLMDETEQFKTDIAEGLQQETDASYACSAALVQHMLEELEYYRATLANEEQDVDDEQERLALAVEESKTQIEYLACVLQGVQLPEMFTRVLRRGDQLATYFGDLQRKQTYDPEEVLTGMRRLIGLQLAAAEANEFAGTPVPRFMLGHEHEETEEFFRDLLTAVYNRTPRTRR